ncbi:hypothetical protein BH10PSE16_BH10PSE16_29750 [soil metagenome]
MCHSPEVRSILLANAGQSVGPIDIAVEDWDMMFRAVTDRLLAQCTDGLLATPCLLQVPPSASAIQTVVLECVEALEQLHRALKLQRS